MRQARPADAPPRDPAGDATGHAGASLRIHLLGGFRAALGTRPVGEGAWRLQKAKALVKLLALAPGHHLGREHLLDLLWPDLDPEAAGNNFHRTLHAARRALAGGREDRGAGPLQLRGGVLTLRPAGALWVDTDAFEAAARDARRRPDPATYEAAIALYTGDPLPEDRYEDWAAPRREALRGTFLELLLGAARLHEGRGAWDRAIAALERLVAEEPSHEDGHVGLMRLYARAGRRGQALRQWARLQEALRRDLDAAPDPASRRLYAEILAGRFPAGAPTPAPPMPAPRRDNLPSPLTSFIGRARERAAVGERLDTTRLLTLTGPGGGGKTRLALAVAADRATGGGYPDGVWLVELAALVDPALVPGAVAGVLGVRADPARPPLDTLVAALRGRALLLVLDNCEHLAAACAHLARRLLDAAPAVRILATSRAALRVAGEVTWAVPPLGVPDARAAPAALMAGEAVALFVDRARLRRPGFALTARDAPAAAEICRRLDGLPLALELAAARVALLSPAQLAARLDDALAVLAGGDRATPARQRTLRATLDWSHALLDDAERALLRRLAVFAGGWTLAAAEAVCGDDTVPADDILVMLAGLVDQSLVQVEDEAPGAEARYRLLEPVRQYARERLVASGEAAGIESAHAAHYLALAEAAEPGLTGAGQAAALARLDREHDNLRTALRRAVAGGDLARAAALGAALWRFWYVRGHPVEGERWLTGILARPAGDALPALAQAKLLQGVGTLAVSRGDVGGAEGALRTALALFRGAGDRRGTAAVLHARGLAAERRGEYARAARAFAASLRLREAIGDVWGAATTLQTLGNIAAYRGDPRQAAALYERSLALHRQIGDPRGLAIALNGLGNLAHDAGDAARAAALYRESLDLLRALGDTPSSAVVLQNLACLARRRGDYPQAAGLYAEGLRLAREALDQRGIALGLDGLAGVAALRGDPPGARRAAHLYGAAAALRAAHGLSLEPSERDDLATTVAAARATLGEAAFAAAWAAGGALSPEEAVAGALTIAAEVLDAPAPPA